MRGIREIMKSRYSEDTRNKFSFDEKYDRDLSDKDTFEEWQNWMRSLAGGQTVTSANDAAWFARADADQRALMGASFNIMERMPSLFSGEADFLDGARDYIKAAIYDPTTPLGLGIGSYTVTVGGGGTGDAPAPTHSGSSSTLSSITSTGGGGGTRPGGSGGGATGEPSSAANPVGTGNAGGFDPPEGNPGGANIQGAR